MDHAGIFEAVCAHPAMQGVRLQTANLGKAYVPHGDLPHLYQLTGLTAGQLADRAAELIRQGREKA